MLGIRLLHVHEELQRASPADAGGPIAGVDSSAVARGALFLGLLSARRVAPGAAAWQSQNDRCFSLLLSQSILTLRCAAHRSLGKGETAMRQFSVGEVVTWIPDLLLRWETHGDYRIVAAMPDQDGHHMYRIKSPLEEYERVVKEDLLAKSNGYLPEEVPARVSRRSSITLPTLQPA